VQQSSSLVKSYQTHQRTPRYIHLSSRGAFPGPRLARLLVKLSGETDIINVMVAVESKEANAMESTRPWTDRLAYSTARWTVMDEKPRAVLKA